MDEKQIEFMRHDLDGNFALSRMIDIARQIIEAKGLNFEEEFSKWKEAK